MSILEEIAAARETMENEDGRQRLAKLKRELLTAGPDSFALLEQRTPLLLLPDRKSVV